MINSSILPQYKTVIFANNPQTGYYTKTSKQPCKTPVMCLPYELKVEPTQLHQIKCNALQIIRGKETFKSGAFKFFTGIQETGVNQWYAGNDYEILKTGKRLTLCLFHFTKEGERLTVFYFSRYYIENREARERFIATAIDKLLKDHFL